jgi:hypothetical protein
VIDGTHTDTLGDFLYKLGPQAATAKVIHTLRARTTSKTKPFSAFFILN